MSKGSDEGGHVDFTPDELMTVAASRALRNDDVCFVGIGAPSEACNLARLTHAPDIVLIYESGTLQTRPDVLPLSIGDGELCETALTTVPVVEMFQYWLQGGRISKGFLGGAQIDRFANINTTVIGDYDAPKVRLPGGGGAPEIAGSCHEVLITARHSARTLVDTVDFVTSLGHGSGPGDREAAGLTTAGPVLVVTDLCLLEPDPETRELVVTSLHPGVDRDQVVTATGWEVRFADELATTPPPTAEELQVLRDLHARTEQAHAGG
ncbi:MAG: CoA-transferase subunit beta [Actinobacteria bacterium]|jgi:glutaconate CoA-transferase subunit B|nr:CoA-transferase subunit beta [Actinomycetota bacterium]